LRRGIGLFVGLAAVAVAGCGSSGARQDAAEPSGNYPVEITKAKFPTRQRLAQVVNLEIAVRNSGEQTIPNLALTVFVDPNADRPFEVRTDQPSAANPSRPVWIPEHGDPRLAGASGSAGAQTANLSTFQFGPLSPGETREAVWRLSPVHPGTYTLTYQVSAGLQGKAKAINADGSAPTGKFLVTISGAPPNAGVGDKGQVIIQPPDSAPKKTAKAKKAKSKKKG
jgi:hypothetical protein